MYLAHVTFLDRALRILFEKCFAPDRPLTRDEGVCLSEVNSVFQEDLDEDLPLQYAVEECARDRLQSAVPSDQRQCVIYLNWRGPIIFDPKGKQANILYRLDAVDKMQISESNLGLLTFESFEYLSGDLNRYELPLRKRIKSFGRVEAFVKHLNAQNAGQVIGVARNRNAFLTNRNNLQR